MTIDAKTPLIDAKNMRLIEKLRIFLGHYDLRIYITDTAYIDIGRGSFDAALRIELFKKPFSGCLGTVGQFCDFAGTAAIHGGGDHQNAMPVNVMMTNVAMLNSVISDDNITTLQTAIHRPFSIGNAVVLSEGARVLPGSYIGDGTLIGACSLVRGDVEPFSIYGGVSAKKLKNRVNASAQTALECVRWWDFDIVYLGKNLSRLQELAVDTSAQHIYKKPQPRLVIKLINADKPNTTADILGFLDGDQQYKLSDAPAKMREYLNQLSTGGPY